MLRGGFVLGLSFALVSIASGDVVYRKSGGKVSGEVDAAKSTSEHVVIRSRFGSITVPRSDIERIEETARATGSYQEAAKAVKATPEDQFQLALWCLENQYRKEYVAHLEKTIELDPNHAEARKRLGFQLVGDKWLKRDEVLESQGYVKYKGRFVLPQEKELAESADRDKATQQKHYRDIRVWQKWLRSADADKQKEAAENLRRITDPLAIEPLVRSLDEKGNNDERLLLAEVLRAIEGDASTHALLDLAIQTDSTGVRSEAIEGLTPRKTPTLIAGVVKFLADNENQKVRNAAAILNAIGDSSVVPALIDALVTEHRHVYNPSFADKVRMTSPQQSFRVQTSYVRPDGVMVRRSQLSIDEQLKAASAGGINVGSPPGQQIFIEQKRNPEVLEALTTLTDENFGYDKDRWLEWVKDSYQQGAAKTKN